LPDLVEIPLEATRALGMSRVADKCGNRFECRVYCVQLNDKDLSFWEDDSMRQSRQLLGAFFCADGSWDGGSLYFMDDKALRSSAVFVGVLAAVVGTCSLLIGLGAYERTAEEAQP
jgi:hypothetical protein